jgi:hypothetical protein
MGETEGQKSTDAPDGVRTRLIYAIAFARSTSTSKEPTVERHCITPGKPMRNGLVESFIGRLRDECLNENSSPACAMPAI